MERRFHRGFTAAEKTELWDRWKHGGVRRRRSGELLVSRHRRSIFWLPRMEGFVLRSGVAQVGIDACGTRGDFQGVTARRSARSIAKLLGRSPSTVSREWAAMAAVIATATVADENAWARSRRPKCCKLAINSRLRRAVTGKLRLDWSPEQIAGWLKRTHPEDEYNQVSHETIYRSLFVQARGVLKKELLAIFDRSALDASLQAG